jgi:pyruvate/2-oxoglutarate dehydrogenase complex dihydrolipoamide dehydrogenase (E3) component
MRRIGCLRMAVNRASAAGNPPAWLNVGCIPSKALLHSSVAAVAASYGLHGIMLGCVYLNVRRQC